MFQETLYFSHSRIAYRVNFSLSSHTNLVAVCKRLHVRTSTFTAKHTTFSEPVLHFLKRDTLLSCTLTFRYIVNKHITDPKSYKKCCFKLKIRCIYNRFQTAAIFSSFASPTITSPCIFSNPASTPSCQPNRLVGTTKLATQHETPSKMLMRTTSTHRKSFD